MEYIKKLENYLIGTNGYLKSDISKGKVILVSGVWGSGKTYFWQNNIDPKLKNSIYISLYGKTSISDIENEVIIKAYYKSLGRDNQEKDIVEKISSTFTILPKTVDAIAGTKINEVIKEISDINDTKKGKVAKEFIKDLVICFDDFERKSTKIDLQDLFGFITNLALEFESRVVIVLNSNVFKGEDKKIFNNIKEKTVSKYLLFNPSSSELFEIIFKEYEKNITEYKSILKQTINEVGIVNARIYKQVLDNIVEWVKSDNNKEERTIKTLVLLNINFILNNYIYYASIEEYDKNEPMRILHELYDENSSHYPVKYTKGIFFDDDIKDYIEKELYDINNEKDLIETLKLKIITTEKDQSIKEIKLKYIEDNISKIKGYYFNWNNVKAYCNVEDEKSVEIFNKMVDFVKTGILVQ